MFNDLKKKTCHVGVLKHVVTYFHLVTLAMFTAVHWCTQTQNISNQVANSRISYLKMCLPLH